MGKDLVPYPRPPSDELHPAIYLIMVGLAVWLVLSVWAFASNPGTEYLLVVVSGFFVVFLAIPAALWQTWRHQRRDTKAPHGPSLRDWAAGDFKTWQYRTTAKSTAVEILLPLAAVAFGMTAFGIAFQLVNYFR